MIKAPQPLLQDLALIAYLQKTIEIALEPEKYRIRVIVVGNDVIICWRSMRSLEKKHEVALQDALRKIIDGEPPFFNRPENYYPQMRFKKNLIKLGAGIPNSTPTTPDKKSEQSKSIPEILDEGEVFSLPSLSTDSFVGRQELSEQLMQIFHAQNPAYSDEVKDSTVICLPKQALLYGLGGVGKSELALQYAHKTEKIYQQRMWFSADDRIALLHSYQKFITENLANAAQFSEAEIIQTMQNWFASQSHWLAVYDNVKSYDDIYEGISDCIPNVGLGDILFTSRLAPIAWARDVSSIRVDVLSPAEANLLVAEVARINQIDPAISQLTQLLGYLPLALVQAAQFMLMTSASSATQYLRSYNKNPQYMLSRSEIPSNFREYDATFVTWDKDLESLSAHTKALLQFCAYLAPKNIPYFLLHAWFQHTYPDEQALFEDSLQALETYSLIQINKKDSFIQMHLLLQYVVRQKSSPEEQKKQLSSINEMLEKGFLIKQLIEQLHTMFLPSTLIQLIVLYSTGLWCDKTWSVISLIPHLESVATHSQQYPDIFGERETLKITSNKECKESAATFRFTTSISSYPHSLFFLLAPTPVGSSSHDSCRFL